VSAVDVGPPTGRAESHLYGIFAETLSFPTRELADMVESGLLRMTVEMVAKGLPGEVRLPTEGLGPGGLSARMLESEYIRLFDVPDGVPTPLYCGVYAPRRRDAMEELLRLYRHFGLTVNGEAHDLPDFAPTVLEFLQFLSHSAAVASQPAREARERAMADVLERHFCPWAEQTASRLARREPLPFYRSLVEAAAALGVARLRQLRASYPAGASSARAAVYAPTR